MTRHTTLIRHDTLIVIPALPDDDSLVAAGRRRLDALELTPVGTRQ